MPAKTVALVLRGPAWQDDLTISEQSAIGGHLGFMGDLVRTGVLEAAGPFVTPDERLERDLVGFTVFSESDAATAERVLEDDPARAVGTIRYEVLTWHL